MSDDLKRSRRHLGTYYYAGERPNPFGAVIPRAGGVAIYETCGHKHATVRAAMRCKKKFRDPVIFQAFLGRLPAKVMD